MSKLKVLAPLFALSMSLFLSGCFVISTHPPLQNGPVDDEDLVGDWRGLDADTGEEDDVFIHIQRADPDEPLRLIFVENNEYQVYEMRTSRAGNRKVFAAKLIAPLKGRKNDSEMPAAHFIGFYEAGPDEITFHLLDAEKVRELIKSGQVKGNPGKSKYDFTQLTGSPADVTRFLESQDAWNSRSEDPARLKRLSRKKD